MLKLKKNKRKDLYIFLARRDLRKLTCLTAKFQEEPTEPLREITWGSYGISRKFQFWSGEEMLVKNWVSLFYCRCYADFVSESLFNQIFMFTVTSIIAL